MDLAFASLHQLCAPLLDRLARLPLPQRQALETVFGVRAGPPPDRFLVRCRLAPDRARAHLLYGEWLRREGRHVDARGQLRAAREEFTSIGMEAFAKRARQELLATGGHVRKRSAETGEELTAEEAQVAELARAGLSNPEIGARLFISRHTVEHHLRKVFTKLGISSRHQLEGALPREPQPALPA